MGEVIAVFAGKCRFLRDCSSTTGFIQPVHDAVMPGFVDGLQRGLHATYPAQDVYEALLGFQGRGRDEVVSPDLCHALFL